MIVNLLDLNSTSSLQGDVAASWDLIDWRPLGEDLGAPAYFDQARAILLAPTTAKNLPEIEESFNQLDRIIGYSDSIETIFQHDISYLPNDKRAYYFLPLLAKAHVPDFAQLNIVCLLIEAMDALAPYLASGAENEVVKLLKRQLCRPWRVFVQRDGEVVYERHPVLAPLFRQLFRMEQDLRQEIIQLARHEKYAKALQMPQHDIMHERYVLPIKSDAYTSAMGAIVDRSGGGHTLYVEPYEMRQLSNQRLELMARCEEAKYRICLEYVPILQEHARAITSLFEQLINMDVLRCRALFCLKHNMHRPKLTANIHIKLTDFFHPLVQHPVLNSIEIDANQLGVILSGPNTGGKTVALKSICLSLIFIHRGLFVPAKEAELFPFQGIFFIGHDQQNLSAGLSSFAAEASNYLNLLGHLRQSNAIFIDEIFNSTSSDEASALAQALFDEIHRHSQAFIFVSTHHQFLKTSMHQRKTYLSGHVGIDLETRRPTYKLYWGTPGSSHALTIFKRLSDQIGSGQDIVTEAAAHLQSGHRLYETLLEELGGQKVKLDKQLQETRNLNHELQNQRKASDGILKLKRQEILQEFKDKMDECEKRAQQIILEANKGQISRPTMGKRFDQLRSELLKSIGDDGLADVNENKLPEGKWRPVDAAEISEGIRLHSLRHAKSVEVLSYNSRKKEIAARVGNLRLNLPLEDLVVAQDRPIHRPQTQVQVDMPPVEDTSTRLDGRGMRLDDFIRLVERQLSTLAQGHIPFLEIIHGHGDGILKSWVRKELKTYTQLKWRIPEGNDGATIVEKGSR